VITATGSATTMISRKKEQHYDKEKNNIVDHIAACGIASSL
jgi:hypothetical protein